ncbi:MAG: YihY/virulence factor BrkB family protein [Planctomycetaceae bacterium]|nr:YihY/virulence factor BrkB family protein [Planctomycetaceae bacterium]
MRWIYRRLWPALKTSVWHWSSDHGSLHTAALAYYAAFSLFPLCLTLVSVLGLVARFSGQAQNQQQKLLELAHSQLGPWFASQLQSLLAGLKSQAFVSGPLGLLTLAVAGLAIFVQLQTMFDEVWKAPERESQGWLAAIWSIVYQRMVAFLMLLGVGTLLVALFAANMYFAGVSSVMSDLPLNSWRTIRWGLLVLGNAMLVMVVFKTIPRLPVRWLSALCGGIFVALIWQFGQHLLATLVISDRYSVYGVVGSFIAVMVWFYYASIVVFFGAELVRALDAPQSPSDNGGKE